MANTTAILDVCSSGDYYAVTIFEAQSSTAMHRPVDSLMVAQAVIATWLLAIGAQVPLRVEKNDPSNGMWLTTLPIDQAKQLRTTGSLRFEVDLFGRRYSVWSAWVGRGRGRER